MTKILYVEIILFNKYYFLYYTALYVSKLQHTDPITSHITQEFWILYRDSTAGFGSSSLNKDKNI